ncbi:NAD(+)/NADH kinase [Agromyces endophyticus]|uniref:diacylglycerol/lipid kinase family protein n=1 Tax=Agromyces sp. H17E-10 TaxID=2932244 RepID=UPI001FD53EB3|nr:diacylglycerol kinase family protein [Agromyces sp. H17E-10]UOQ90716.1 NAD(+)/NADH kinase [Agromyces sp. H17E-10]
MTADHQPTADASEPRPRAAIISNPTKSGVDALRAAVERAEERQGFAPSLWIDTAEDDPGKGMAREAVEKGVDLVVAAGGDGTVRSVAAGLRGTGVPLGIVPLGTGNLFARNLDIPVNDVDDAVVLAFAGLDRAVDVLIARVRRPDGTTESHASLVMAGIGIDATMIANTNPDLKKKVGWLAYVDAGLRALPNSEPFRVVHRLDGGRHHRSRVSSILVANLGYLPGNLELIPDAEIDDGRLDVVRLQPRNLFGWLFVWRVIAWENRVMRKTAIGRQVLDLTGGNRRQVVAYSRGRTVDLVIEGGPQEFEIDGDEFGTVAAARFEVDPASLIVRVPR